LVQRSNEGEMQIIRRRDGDEYLLEAYSSERGALEQLQRQWKGAYIQYERDGVPIPGDGKSMRSSGPTYALWRPHLVLPDELEDLADLLAPSLATLSADDDPASEAVSSGDAAAVAPPGSPAETVSVAPLSVDQATRAHPPEVGKRMPRPRGSNKNITRVDYAPKNTHGFMVRVGWKGELHQRFFSDKQYSDRAAALAAAIAWRNEKERELGKPRSERLVIGKGKSNTGIIGVTRTTAAGDPVFQVTWYENGRQRRKKFNIRRLGEDTALRQAQQARAEAVRKALSRG
jgi:hypothetical protein